MQQAATVSNPQIKEFRTVISKTNNGEIIREKFGYQVLLSKEICYDKGFFVINIHRIFCEKCNQLQKLEAPQKIYVVLGERSTMIEKCKFCGHLNKYKFQ